MHNSSQLSFAVVTIDIGQNQSLIRESEKEEEKEEKEEEKEKRMEASTDHHPHPYSSLREQWS
jgi:hypothetical protein